MAVRQICFGVLAVISGFFAFYLFRTNLEFSEKAIFIVAGLLILAVFWGLAAFFITNKLLSYLLSALISVLFLVFFGFGIPYLISAVLILIALIWGHYEVQKEKNARIKILPEKIIHAGLTPMLFTLSIVLAIAVYFSPNIQKLKKDFVLPVWAEEQAIKIALPAFSQNLTVDEMINVFAKRNLKEPVPDELRKKALKEIGLETLTLKGNEKIADRPEILHQLVSEPVQDMLGKFSKYLPFIFAFIAWQVLLALDKLLIPLAVFFDLLVYLALLKTGAIQIKKTMVEKEELI